MTKRTVLLLLVSFALAQEPLKRCSTYAGNRRRSTAPLRNARSRQLQNISGVDHEHD
jgi:hypothetical protein